MPNAILVPAALIAVLSPTPPMQTPSALRSPIVQGQPVVAHTSFRKILPRPSVNVYPHNVLRIVGTENGIEQTVLLRLAAPPKDDDLRFLRTAKRLQIVSSGSRIRMEYSDRGKTYVRIFNVLEKSATVRVLKRSAP